MSEIAKHSEILFLWDAKMTNPNGDMLKTTMRQDTMRVTEKLS